MIPAKWFHFRTLTYCVPNVTTPIERLTIKVKGGALLRRPANEGSDFDRSVRDLFVPGPTCPPSARIRGRRAVSVGAD